MDRRRFLQVGAVAGLGVMVPWGAARRLAYVAGEGVHVFAGVGGGWELVRTVACVAASGVAVSPGGRFVYVGNAVDGFEGRPSGSVEAFAADGRGGLRSVGRRGLALFAHGPERLAVSPSGRWLAVGLGGGGYNLLRLGEDGVPGRVTASLRRLGAAGLAGELAFAGDRLLLSLEGGRVTGLSVGEDGALGFVDGGAMAMDGADLDAGLVRAMAEAGVGGRVAVALSHEAG